MKKIIISVLSFLAIISTANAYTVKQGDTLNKIAIDNNTTVQKIVVDNAIQNPNLIYVGQELNLQSVENLGVQIPQVIALFETSLASQITNLQTTMTLMSGTTKNGTTLSGTFGMIIDEGLANEEFVLATCANTACSAMRRGLSVIDGWTEITALKFKHRRGASVKLTNYPQLAILSRILDGTTSTPAILLADSQLSNSSIIGNQYALVTYVNGVGAGGFTVSNVATNRGLAVFGTSPETVGIATTTNWNFGTQSFDRVTAVGDITTFIDMDNTPYIALVTGAKQHIYLDNTETMFNYAGNDINFNVYNNHQLPLFSIDSSVNKIGIATSTFNTYTSKFVIATSTTLAGNLNVVGNATTTGSMSIKEICIEGANCSSIINPKVGQSLAGVSTAPTRTDTFGVATTTLTAGTLGPNSVTKVKFWGTHTAANGQLSVILTFGGTTIFNQVVTASAVDGFSGETIIANRNSLSSQITNTSIYTINTKGHWANSTTTATINTANSNDIKLWFLHGGNGNDTSKLEGYFVEILK